MNVVFDLGGTFLRCGVDIGSDRLANVLSVPIAHVATNGSDAGAWQRLFDAMRDYVLGARASFGDPESVVVAFPGPIRGPAQPLCAPTVVRSDATVPDISYVGCGSTTYVINDVSAAAWYFGETTDCERFLVVTVSSGIGSKLYDRARSHRVFDDEPFAGELGHVTVDFTPNAPACDCGGRGHLGAISSGRGIERLARRTAAGDPKSFARSLCAQLAGAGDLISNEAHIVPAARAGDQWVLEVIERASEPLATMLATAFQVCGLQKIYVVGGFANAAGPAYESLLDSAVRKRLAPPAFGTPAAPVVEVRDADNACLYGAAFFARARVFAPL